MKTLTINSACKTVEFYRNSIQYRTLNMSGGAPLFIMCLCLRSRKDVSCSFISSSIPCILKLACAKIYFLLPARNYKA